MQLDGRVTKIDFKLFSLVMSTAAIVLGLRYKLNRSSNLNHFNKFQLCISCVYLYEYSFISLLDRIQNANDYILC